MKLLPVLLALSLVVAPAFANTPELEAKLAESMTGVTMTGRFALIKDGELGPEKPEEYTIVSITKAGGDAWIVNARIRYQQQDIVAPIPVKVKWAGSTPVIVVDELAIPGGGTYSARVIIDGNSYAGTWSGGTHQGLLNGVIKKTPKP